MCIRDSLRTLGFHSSLGESSKANQAQMDFCCSDSRKFRHPHCNGILRRRYFRNGGPVLYRPIRSGRFSLILSRASTPFFCIPSCASSLLLLYTVLHIQYPSPVYCSVHSTLFFRMPLHAFNTFSRMLFHAFDTFSVYHLIRTTSFSWLFPIA